MVSPEADDKRDDEVTPIARTLNRILDRRAARPRDVYRLAIIVEGLLDSMEDQQALATIRNELRALLQELSSTAPEADSEQR